jgi:hypothetical protein
MPTSPTRRSPSIRQQNIAHNQASPSLRVSSAQDDPDNCFNKIQLRWKTLRNHHDTDLYWFFRDDHASLVSNSGIITEWLLLLLVELDIPTLPGVKWTGHSLRRDGICSARHRRFDCSHHDLGLMEVSRVSAPLLRRLCAAVLRSSLLLRPPACALQSSSSATCSTSSTNCRELVDRPERRFGSVARAR